MNIRVINLSYGTHSTQPYTVDPLAYAVENAWRKGIVVVAAAGNDGAGSELTMPAADPYVLAVGAVDHVGTTIAQATTSPATFTNSGTPDATARPARARQVRGVAARRPAPTPTGPTPRAA